MLISYVIGARAPGSRRFGDSFPTVFQIQDLIEHAWDMGYNAQGRVETGGIRGTRKFIGTPEVHSTIPEPEALQPAGRCSILLFTALTGSLQHQAHALFCGLDIP